MDISPKEYAARLKLYKEYLCYHIDPRQCESIASQCFNNDHLSQGEHAEISYANDNHKTETLLKIVCKKEKTRLFRSFNDALIQKKLKYVANTLAGEPPHTTFFEDFYIHALRNLEHKFLEILKPADILNVYWTELMDRQTYEEIQVGTVTHQAWKLHQHLTKRPNTVLKFMKALREQRSYSHLVDLVDGVKAGDDSGKTVHKLIMSGIEEILEPNDLLQRMNFDSTAINLVSGIRDRKQRVKTFFHILVSKPGWFKLLKTAINEVNTDDRYTDLLESLEWDPDDDDADENNLSVAHEKKTPASKDDGWKSTEMNFRGDGSNANLEATPSGITMNDSRRSPSPSPAENGLKLTEEQKKLARDALKGENCVIVAPTGYGKTYVAFYICQEHLKLGPGLKRVVILAPTGPILDQHYTNLKLYFDESKYKMAKLGGGGAARTPSAAILESNQIVVMTPKKLLNAINEDNFDLGQISLLIFDECHHAVKNEPYNEIMEHYLQRMSPRRGDKLPQIVGFTATPGSGEAGNKNHAVDHVITLLANLDVTIAPLEVASSSMSLEPIAVKRPAHDQVSSTIIQMMKIIEKKVKSLIIGNKNVLETGFKFEPLPRWGYPDYENEIVALDKRCDSVGDVDLSQKLRICAKCLRTFNDALLMNELLRPVDAKDFIEEKLFDHRSTNPIEQKMKELYDKSGLARKANDRPCALLQEAIDLLKRHFETNPDSRCIVFVKTRKTAQMLSDCFSKDPSLISLSLNPTYFTGTNAKTTDGGLTKSQQTDHLRQFRVGDSKLLVSTNVAEEGINIPACNLVIAYNYCSNDVGQVQRQGRARVKDSKTYLLSYGDRKFIERERANIARNQLVSKALQQLKYMDPKDLREKVKDIQSKRIRMKITSPSKPSTSSSSLPSNLIWKLLCHCGLEVTTSDRFRLKKDHHVIVDREFASKARVDQNQNTKIIRCAKPDCKRKWGSSMQMRHDVPMPVLDISCFTLVKDDGTRTSASKWNKAPFKVEKELDDSDIAVLMGESADAVSDQESSLDDYSLDF